MTAGTAPPSSLTIDATTNRISGDTYDANGNLKVEPFTPSNNNYSYDGENRLVTFASGSASATYSYDGNSLRVKKVSGSTTTVYVFSGSKVIAEYANGSLSKEYVYSGSQLLATIAGTTTTYHHADHLSVRLSTNSSGTKVGDQGHFPFGESWYLTNTTTKWQFTSYERDAESGNDYAMARYYMNRVGRFSSPDLLFGSAEAPQSWNRYAYVRDDPIENIDPSGQLCLLYTWGLVFFGTEGLVVIEVRALGECNFGPREDSASREKRDRADKTSKPPANNTQGKKICSAVKRFTALVTAPANVAIGTVKVLTGLFGEAATPATGPASPLAAVLSTREVVNGGGQALSGLASFVYAVTGSETAEAVSNYSTALTTESGIITLAGTGKPGLAAGVGSIQNGIPTQATVQAAAEAFTALTEIGGKLLGVGACE